MKQTLGDMPMPTGRFPQIAKRILGDTAYTDVGTGYPVVLIHGVGLDLQLWKAQLSELQKDFRVIAYDVLGHGGSAKSATCSLSLYADQLLRLLDGLKIRRATIVGFSLGGLIAQAFAIRHPDRVAAVAILHCAFQRTRGERELVLNRVRMAEKQGPDSIISLALDRWFTQAFAKRHPETLERVAQWLRDNDHESYKAAYRLVAEGDAEVADEIDRITCPALVMTGADDRGNSPGMALRMAEIMKNARSVILPGLRHMALMEDPNSITGPLKTFLLENRAQETQGHASSREAT